MDKSILNKQRKRNVIDIFNFLSNFKVKYNQMTWCYTPITIYPRSMTPKVRVNETITLPNNLSEFRTLFYVHIPYCTSRCTFCPYFLEVSKNVSDKFVNGLVKHIESILKEYPKVKRFNLYFGGGSPNLLSIEQVRRIAESFRKYQSGIIDEFTMELHPEIINNINYLREIVDLGVNRISFGLQSTDPIILKNTVRRHKSYELIELVREVKDLGATVNIDVMYGGLPKETQRKNYETFKYAFSVLKPDWITGYQVRIQEGTLEAEKFLRSRNDYPNTLEMLSACSLIHQVAEEEGYNYINGGYFSRKKQIPNYQKSRWEERSVLIAFGPGTYSYIINNSEIEGVLWWAPFDSEKYLKLVKKQKWPIERKINCKTNDLESWIAMLGVKRGRPIPDNLSFRLINNLEKLTNLEFLVKTNKHFKIAQKGLLIEDLICASFISRKTWEKFKEIRKENNYGKEKRYDLFFKPETVLKFQEAIGIE